MQENEIREVLLDFQESWEALISLMEENLAPNLELRKVNTRKDLGEGELEIAVYDSKSGVLKFQPLPFLDLSGKDQEEIVETLLDFIETEEFKRPTFEDSPSGAPNPPRA